MKRDDRKDKLIDLGSTTALSALVEIRERRDDGALHRQAMGMFCELSDVPLNPDFGLALRGFLDEIQGVFEALPGILPRKRSDRAPERLARRARS